MSGGRVNPSGGDIGNPAILLSRERRVDGSIECFSAWQGRAGFCYLPFEPAAADSLFQLVSRRYERGSILITSSRAVGDWDTVLGDQVVAIAILDRLLHYSHVLTIRGDSYRLREKRRSGLLKATPAPVSAEVSQ